ncbi:MAG: hypothetical protein KIC66_14985, partial [Clostridium sp.]|nr:hypothetical protein [Clostridium sp.]
DEVTAVGDARFKEKCAQLFKERHKESSFLMVSHSLNSLKEFCDVALFISRDHQTCLYQNINEAIKLYQNDENLNI